MLGFTVMGLWWCCSCGVVVVLQLWGCGVFVEVLQLWGSGVVVAVLQL